MHDNPLRIKVEVEDASASPSLAPKITGTDVKMKDLESEQVVDCDNFPYTKD